MQKMTQPRGTQVGSNGGGTTPGGENKSDARVRHILEAVLWGIGFIVLMVASVMVHNHPGPWPFDLQTTIMLQHIHYPGWLLSCIGAISRLNDPIPAGVALALWFIGLALFRKFRQAIFIAVGVTLADWFDFVLNHFVGRPRPSSPLIHVYMPEPIFSFPSGHTEHDMVYYGFLLYLSFSKPVRQWRYYRFLIPLQVLAVVIMLVIGYSRVLEGSHWVTDALAGYLSGALLLFVLIRIYRWTTAKLAGRKVKWNTERFKSRLFLAHRP